MPSVFIIKFWETRKTMIYFSAPKFRGMVKLYLLSVHS